jgi:hypothetical protein
MCVCVYIYVYISTHTHTYIHIYVMCIYMAGREEALQARVDQPPPAHAAV